MRVEKTEALSEANLKSANPSLFKELTFTWCRKGLNASCVVAFLFGHYGRRVFDNRICHYYPVISTRFRPLSVSSQKSENSEQFPLATPLMPPSSYLEAQLPDLQDVSHWVGSSNSLAKLGSNSDACPHSPDHSRNLSVHHRQHGRSLQTRGRRACRDGAVCNEPHHDCSCKINCPVSR